MLRLQPPSVNFGDEHRPAPCHACYTVNENVTV